VVDGIFHRLQTGAHWRDLPKRFGPWKTVYERHRLWLADGTWEYLFQQIQADADGEDDRDISVDSATVRAHQHAAGARIAPPAPFPKGDAGSELAGEAPRLSSCDRLAEVVQAPKGNTPSGR
jgi:hypothetical protein